MEEFSDQEIMDTLESLVESGADLSQKELSFIANLVEDWDESLFDDERERALKLLEKYEDYI